MRPVLKEEEIAVFRESVCRAAEVLFARHGVEGVTMRQIATEVGFSSTAAYRYFKNKDEILGAVRASAFNRFSAVIEKATTSGSDVRRSAQAVGQAYLSFALANPDAYRMMFDVRQDSIAHYPELAEALQRANRCMVVYAEALVEKESLHCDAHTLGQMLWATAHGLVMLRLSGIVSTDDKLQSLHKNAMSALVRGIASGSPTNAETGVRKLGLVKIAALAKSPKKRA